jgi:hypothetical protein
MPRPRIDFRQLYDRFDAPLMALDCGAMCAPHNPRGIPFCCDICQAVPAVYQAEWAYLRENTGLWHEWRGDECPGEAEDPAELSASIPEDMLLLACQGPARCQRAFRALSCRQFPFFPYLTSRGHFIGLVYDWEYEATCWVISHLAEVTETYRRAFVQAYDELFSLWPDELESYALLSGQVRERFAGLPRRFPLLHRGGGVCLVSPVSERMHRVEPLRLRRFGPYVKD